MSALISLHPSGKYYFWCLIRRSAWPSVRPDWSKNPVINTRPDNLYTFFRHPGKSYELLFFISGISYENLGMCTDKCFALNSVQWFTSWYCRVFGSTSGMHSMYHWSLQQPGRLVSSHPRQPIMGMDYKRMASMYRNGSRQCFCKLWD